MSGLLAPPSLHLRRRSTLEALALDAALELGAGGEARVMEIPGDDSLVAKLYHASVEHAVYSRKVAAMLELGNASVGELVLKLEKSGFVRRVPDPQDRRAEGERDRAGQVLHHLQRGGAAVQNDHLPGPHQGRTGTADRRKSCDSGVSCRKAISTSHPDHPCALVVCPAAAVVLVVAFSSSPRFLRSASICPRI